MIEKLTEVLTWKTTMIFIIIAMIGLWSWALGKVPIAGDYGFVLQADLEKRIKQTVGRDIDDLKAQSTTTSDKVDSIKTSLDAVLADLYGKRLKEGVRQRCKLPPTATEERDRLWDQINRDLNLYRKYSGDPTYVRPGCEEV